MSFRVMLTYLYAMASMNMLRQDVGTDQEHEERLSLSITDDLNLKCTH